MGRGAHPGREAGGVPIDLVLLVVLVVAIVVVGAWYTVQSGGPGWIVVVGGVAVVAFLWAFARRIRRRDESVVAGQRKVGHDESWTSGQEDE